MLEPGEGRHLAACRESIEDLAPSPRLTAVAELALSLAERLDEKPSTATAAEYRLSWSLLLDAARDEENETADEMMEQAAFLKVVSTPIRPGEEMPEDYRQAVAILDAARSGERALP
ncbi:MAG TPA: hypothetical protein VI462_06170 [Acidimicrobiia bacterium]